MTETLSLAQARRIALAAQGFGAPRPDGPITRRHVGKVIERLHLLQIDSVSVLARAHYLPLFSRLGAYDRTLLDAAAWGKPRSLFEAWAHEASLLPLETEPLFRWRKAHALQGKGIWGSMSPEREARRAGAEALLKRIEADGGLAASDLEDGKGSGGWWGWSDQKAQLEWLWRTGQLMVKTRRTNFERVYDLAERVLPARIRALPAPDEAESHRRLLRLSADALGVATATDLRDYFRLTGEQANPRIPELVENGDLIPVMVKGWKQQAYLAPGARRPRRIEARALLAPFDPVVWERDRTERLYGVRIKLEIYTPAAQRQHGYYVLPFLLGDQIAARVDLKSDRAAGVLRVLSSHPEANAPADMPQHLAAELRLMADWLGLTEIAVSAKGDLAPALAAAVAGF
ncbi:MAG: cytoplasmic protein [Caulobacter sp.]|nr:cytoplasmic protein [Caulobacter sp.]